MYFSQNSSFWLASYWFAPLLLCLALTGCFADRRSEVDDITLLKKNERFKELIAAIDTIGLSDLPALSFELESILEASSPSEENVKYLQEILKDLAVKAEVERIDVLYNYLLAVAYDTREVNNLYQFTRYNKALCLHRAGDYRDALMEVEQALEFESPPDSISWEYRMDMLNAAGVFARRYGDFEGALAHLKCALKQSERYNTPKTKIYINLFTVYSSLNDFHFASQYAYKALAESETHGNKRHIATASRNMGYLHLEMGDYEAAKAFTHKAIRAGGGVNKGTAYTDLAVIARKQDSLALATAYIDTALLIIKDDFYRIDAMIEKFDIMVAARATPEKLLSFVREIDLLAGSMDVTSKQIEVQIVYGKYLLAIGEAEKALSHLDNTYAQLLARGEDYLRIEIFPVHFQALLANREFERAASLQVANQEIIDSLKSDNQRIVLADLNNQYNQYQQKKLNKKLLKAEGKITKGQEKISFLNLIIALIGITLLGVVAFFLYVKNRQRATYLNGLEALQVKVKMLLNKVEREEEIHKGEDEQFGTISLGRRLDDQLTQIEEELQDLDRKLVAFSRDSVETKASLQHQVQRLKLFQYSVVHDLKAPINHLRRLNERSDQSSHQPKLEEAVARKKKIDLHLNSLEEMTKALSTILELDRVTVFPVSFDLGHLVHTIMDEQLHDLNNVAYDLFVPKGAKLESDRYLLRIVLSNLISNSIKYRHKERPLKISLQLDRQEGRNQITYRDNGIGWDATFNETIFLPYARVDVHRKDSSGLGLYISQKVVEKLGGQLTAKAEEGKFAQFSITIPDSTKSR